MCCFYACFVWSSSMAICDSSSFVTDIWRVNLGLIIIIIILLQCKIQFVSTTSYLHLATVWLLSIHLSFHVGCSTHIRHTSFFSSFFVQFSLYSFSLCKCFCYCHYLWSCWFTRLTSSVHASFLCDRKFQMMTDRKACTSRICQHANCSYKTFQGPCTEEVIQKHYIITNFIKNTLLLPSVMFIIPVLY